MGEWGWNPHQPTYTILSININVDATRADVASNARVRTTLVAQRIILILRRNLDNNRAGHRIDPTVQLELQ